MFKNKNRMLIWLRAAVIMVVIFTAGGIIFLDQHKAYKKIASEVEARQSDLEKVELEQKGRELEESLRQIYQNARTIALLPAIRDLKGTNAPKNFKKGWNSAQFPPEAQDTVQQLYNNLAVNVSVSEVYCVLKDFHPAPSGEPDEGETPFFMFDQLAVHAKFGDDDIDKRKSEDYPPEYEGAEYQWLAHDLETLSRQRAKWDYQNLGDIPAHISPVMRTCDNSQYDSKSRGNVHDADGLILTVPFYHQDGDFGGVIAVIIRTNVFEARLLGIPKLIITDADAREAQLGHWTMPSETARFILYNQESQIRIQDRRNQTLSGMEINNPQLISIPLDQAGSGGWQLYLWHDDPLVRATIVKNQKVAQFEMGTTVAGALVLSLFVFFGTWSSLAQESRERTLATLAESLARSAQRVSAEAKALSESSQNLAAGASQQASSLKETTYSLQEITSITVRNAESATKTSTLAQASCDAANEGAARTEEMQQVLAKIKKATQELAQAMDGIKNSSRDVSQVLKTIDEIAFQTHILSINAAVEAARAGAAGAGFAVVAGEVGNLAKNSAEAARETSQMIESSVAQSTRGVEANKNVEMQILEITSKAQALQNSLEKMLVKSYEVDGLISQIAAASKEQSTSLQQVATALGEIDGITQNNASSAQEAAATSIKLNESARELHAIVGSIAQLLNKSKVREVQQVVSLQSHPMPIADHHGWIHDEPSSPMKNKEVARWH